MRTVQPVIWLVVAFVIANEPLPPEPHAESTTNEQLTTPAAGPVVGVVAGAVVAGAVVAGAVVAGAVVAGAAVVGVTDVVTTAAVVLVVSSGNTEVARSASTSV
jgi:hypothetical protein